MRAYQSAEGVLSPYTFLGNWPGEDNEGENVSLPGLAARPSHYLPYSVLCQMVGPKIPSCEQSAIDTLPADSKKTPSAKVEGNDGGLATSSNGTLTLR